MKEYEHVTRTHLVRRTPVIIRIDGRAFHTYTKHIVHADPGVTPKSGPFSNIMHNLMVRTTEQLVQDIQGCVLGYTQSDEISLVLKDWTTLETEAWFDNNLSKILSVSSSIATMSFNRAVGLMNAHIPGAPLKPIATFDSRAYNLPVSEVVNALIWRQQDASRNSVQMLGHHFFSQKEMNGKKNSEIQDMLMLQHGVNWNDLETWKKRGTCVLRSTGVDEDIPIFTQNRAYIEDLL